jgi:hypothetical protein
MKRHPQGGARLRDRAHRARKQLQRRLPSPARCSLGKLTLTDLGRLMQTAQNLELDFLLETSHILKWGYERLKVI